MDQQSITNQVTQNTVNFVQRQIALKNSHTPYYADKNIVNNAITDMDIFPYTRFYRGKYYLDNPVVFEREAGYREGHEASYTPILNPEPAPQPTVCFQPACSTIFPCLANSQSNVEREERNKVLNSQICYNNSV